MFRAKVFALALLASILPANIAFAGIYIPPQNYSEDLVGFHFVDVTPGIDSPFSYLRNAEPWVSNDVPSKSFDCKAFGISPCENLSNIGYAQLILPFCQNNAKYWCLSGIGLKENGKTRLLSFLRNVSGPTTVGNLKLNLPAGGTPSLFLDEETGDKYSVSINTISQKGDGAERKFETGSIFAHVNRYQEKFDSTFTENGWASSNPAEWSFKNLPPECSWQEQGVCGEIQPFRTGTSIQLEVMVGQEISSWLFGRFKNPELKVVPSELNQRKLVVSAEPIDVPTIVVQVPKSSITVSDPTYVFRYNPLSANFVRAPGLLNYWKDKAGDRISGFQPTWSFRTLFTGTGIPCFNNSTATGIVSTNAPAYSGSTPLFLNGQFTYDVSGYHYNPDGSVFKGTYDLVVNKNFVNCHYKISAVPTSASLSIVDEGGKSQVSTFTFSNSGENLRVSAAGFTFSNPKISVKFNYSKLAKLAKRKK